MNATVTPDPGAPWHRRWQRLRDGSVRGFHAYASWLVGISWRRFIVLSLLLVIVMAIVHDMPPFTWTVTREVADNRPVVIRVPEAPKPPAAPQRAEPRVQITPPEPGQGVQIIIGRDGVRIGPPAQGAERAASAAEQPAGRDLRIALPPFGNEFASMMRTTSLLSVISFEELLRATTLAINETFRPMELYAVAAVWYLLMYSAWQIIQHRLERSAGKSLVTVQEG